MKNKSANTTPPSTGKKFLPRFSLRWSLITLFKLLLITVMAIGIAVIYLDGKVRDTFEGQRWQVPVQVYGHVNVLRVGEALNLSTLANTLRLNGYTKVTKATQPGHFEQSAQRIIFYRRAFDFGNGISPAIYVNLAIKNAKIVSLSFSREAFGSSEFQLLEVEEVQVEPILLDRILPESKEDRVLVNLEAVPEKLLDTLLLVEDRDFYFHHGVSPLGILRALFNNLRAGRTVQGGSTLTQQLVKNMFLTRERTLWRKVNEAFMALILEYRYSKDQLLEAYINEVYLGQHYANGIYGFGLAADFYFGKNIAQLNVQQMALLIGQVKGPSYYDPWRYPQRAKKRRNLVLRLMFEQHFLSRIEYEHAVDAPLSIRKNRRVIKQKYPAYLQLVKKELAEHLSDFQQQSGIRVFTGFSHYSQQLLEQTVHHQLPLLENKLSKKQKHKLQAAMIVTDIKTAEIRALVGGRESGYAGFNRALHAKRTIGSLIKPAIYLAALERFDHYNFASLLEDKPLVLTSDAGKEWRPKNYDGKYAQQVPLINGLVNSLNVPTVNLGMALGLNNVANAINLLGYQPTLNLRPSMLLGAIDMSPFEINQLYLPIAAQGFYQKSHAITQIFSGKGETLWQVNEEKEQRLSTHGAYLLDYALSEVTKTGTAKSLTWRLKNKNIAGKTGTSNDLRDSWFVGYDQKHLITTWVGRDDNKPTELTGSSGALLLFTDFIKHQGVVNKATVMPNNIALTLFEQKTGNAVTDKCKETVEYPAVISGVVLQDCLEQNKRSWLERLFGD